MAKNESKSKMPFGLQNRLQSAYDLISRKSREVKDVEESEDFWDACDDKMTGIIKKWDAKHNTNLSAQSDELIDQIMESAYELNRKVMDNMTAEQLTVALKQVSNG